MQKVVTTLEIIVEFRDWKRVYVYSSSYCDERKSPDGLSPLITVASFMPEAFRLDDARLREQKAGPNQSPSGSVLECELPIQLRTRALLRVTK